MPSYVVTISNINVSEEVVESLERATGESDLMISHHP